jgi:3-oxoacyl-[acyl-carrier protein] reductase
VINIDLTGRRALVGGASRGIGAATAEVLAACGASVVLLARDRERLQATAQTLPTQPGQTHTCVAVDYSDPVAVGEAIAEHIDPGVDILVHNTGGPPAGQVSTAAQDALQRAFEQHLLAGHTLLQAVLPGMRERGYGRIINIISTSVKEPIPGLGVSNTIRGAVASWAKTLATELAADGITVNNVLPGFTGTERLDYLFGIQASATGRTAQEVAAAARASVPAQRFAEPREIGQVVAFLASPLAAYVNGINVPVDGGRTRSL